MDPVSAATFGTVRLTTDVNNSVANDRDVRPSASRRASSAAMAASMPARSGVPENRSRVGIPSANQTKRSCATS